VGIPSPFSANTTQYCVYLVLNDDQCRRTMHSSPKYARTGRDRLAWMVENPTGAVTFRWRLLWW